MTTPALSLDDRGAPLRWGGCLLLVAALHAGVAWLVLTHVAIPAVPDAASEAVMLELPPEMASAAPAPEMATPTPPAPQQASIAPSPLAEPPPPDVQPPPAATLQPPPLLTPQVPDPPMPEQQPPDQATAELTPAVVPDPAPLMAPEPPVAVPVPVPVPPPPTLRPVVRPPPARPAAHAIQPRTAPEPPAPTVAAAPPAQPAPSATAAPQPPSNALPTWRGELSARLQRAKRYPESARSRGDQGVAMVTFTLDRTGHVLSVTLARSSDNPSLDEETVALVHRAEPLPAPPPDLPGATVTLTVPVTFSLR